MVVSIYHGNPIFFSEECAAMVVPIPKLKRPRNVVLVLSGFDVAFLKVTLAQGSKWSPVGSYNNPRSLQVIHANVMLKVQRYHWVTLSIMLSIA